MGPLKLLPVDKMTWRQLLSSSSNIDGLKNLELIVAEIRKVDLAVAPPSSVFDEFLNFFNILTSR